MYTTTDAWKASVPLTHSVVHRIDVYQFGVKVGEVEALSGSVSDQWVTGIRRTLNVSLSPSESALVSPGTELRPFCGILYGGGVPEMIPMGRYPLTAWDISARPTELQISASDSYSYVAAARFIRPQSSNAGSLIRDQIALLLQNTGQFPTVTNTATSAQTTPTVVWTGDRTSPIADLAESIGADVHINRSGVPVIRNRPALAASAVATFASGDGGRLVDCTESFDYARMFNAVTVTGTNTDPAQQFDPVTVRITDPNHPAYPRPGVPLRATYLEGAQYTTTAQATVAAKKQLSKVSGPVRSFTIQAIPDPSLDASDTIAVEWDGALERHQIDSISHPLGAGLCQITTATGRDDDA